MFRSNFKRRKLQERTEWFPVKAFGRRAEIAGKYLHKGSRVYLEGRKRTESWEDKKTGTELQGSRLRRPDRVPGFSQQWQWKIHAGRESRRTQDIFRGCPLLSDINRNLELAPEPNRKRLGVCKNACQVVGLNWRPYLFPIRTSAPPSDRLLPRGGRGLTLIGVRRAP